MIAPGAFARLLRRSAALMGDGDGVIEAGDMIEGRAIFFRHAMIARRASRAPRSRDYHG